MHIPVSWAPGCGRTKFENHLNDLISGLISTHLTQASFSKKWCCCLQRKVNHLVSAQSILAQIGVDSISWMKVLLPNPAILTFSSCCCAVRGRNSVQTVTKGQLVVKGIIVFRKSEEFSYSQDRARSIFCKTATRNYKQEKKMDHKSNTTIKSSTVPTSTQCLVLTLRTQQWVDSSWSNSKSRGETEVKGANSYSFK